MIDEMPPEQPGAEGLHFRYSTHPEHLTAPKRDMRVAEIKEIIAQRVADFDREDDLVLEDAGDEPDQRLSDDAQIVIEDVPHFYSAKHQRDYHIVVNGDPVLVHERELTFEQLVKIGYPAPNPGQDVRYTITYKRALKPKHQGALLPGQTVMIRKDGTIFNVFRTYKS